MKKYMLYIISFFLLQKMYAQEVHVEATLDQDSYLIGDYIRLKVKINASKEMQLLFPDFHSIAPEYEFIHAGEVDTILSANQENIFSQEIVYSIYDSGIYTINPISVFFQKPNDTTHYFVQTDSIFFQVNPISVDTTQAIKPIKAILEVEVKNFLWVYILGGAVLGILILYGIYFWRKKNRQEAKLEPKIAPLSLQAETLRKLQQLEDKKLWQQDAIKTYYIELTEIIRTYIETKFQLPALESTSEEIIELLVRAGISGDQIQKMYQLFLLSDLAKFAKSKPTNSENQLVIQLAKDFVIQTSISSIENDIIEKVETEKIE